MANLENSSSFSESPSKSKRFGAIAAGVGSLMTAFLGVSSYIDVEPAQTSPRVAATEHAYLSESVFQPISNVGVPLEGSVWTELNLNSPESIELLKSNDQIIFDFFTKRLGVSEVTAAAFIGNFYVETGGTLSPTTKQMGGPGVGLVQLEDNRPAGSVGYVESDINEYGKYGRYNEALKFIEARNSQRVAVGEEPYDFNSSLEAQLEFIYYELTGRTPYGDILIEIENYESSTQDNLQTRLDKITKIIMDKYEQPSEGHLDRRQAATNKAHDLNTKTAKAA